MAIDPAKSKAVSQVVREHPGMSLVAISPGIVVFLLVGFFANWFLAIVLGVVMVAGGYYMLTRQK
ncbi:MULTISPECIES: hypothetical protein [Gordonia]|uniref:Uncharacterized protein n=1 Tax=Gordonia sputi NBRC 100414 TaxID=1089453 RepID=H5U1S2_9ACTN|nr:MULTISPECIES: hypothetical protein [Gordonia]NKY92063.1 hypothetical protein [Gordonia sputi]OBA40302.1 hypothetical protein A5766_23005 [Gordonia sp. 852002-51296_SCH5728562-b]OBA57065.1 hypothetical protein A5777_07475 [Gordonia sp. 852002-10350_SCH5691597]GAB39680.1 hypothetical protein GOSPT_075_00390 [Gordonia sputi NBRC 100414]